MDRPSTRDGSSTPTSTIPMRPTTPSPTKRPSTASATTSVTPSGTPSATASAGNMAPLDPVSSDRLNAQPISGHRHSIHELASPTRSTHSRDSSVSDKINQFNTLAAQGKSLERKTADAALKRAMLGREEAEAEMHKYKDEARALKRQVEEGRDRERRVGERLETVMVGWLILYLVSDLGSLLITTCDRNNTAAQRRHTPTPRPSGKRRYAVLARKLSSPSPSSSSCKRS